MVAKEHSLNRFLQERDTIFIIPVYQRNYDWTESQCRQLFYDILTVAQERKRPSHFIGSIVYIHEGIYSSARRRELTIIDGQQRLTTISLLWAAMYHRAIEFDEKRLAEKIKEKYLEDDGDVKLHTTQNNVAILDFIISGQVHEKDYPEKSNMIENYNFFRERINEQNIETIQDGISKLIYVDIALERGKDEPQRIFESLNSTGLDLSQGDLIRNYVLMELEPNAQRVVYKDYWRPIEVMTTNRQKNELQLSDFLRHYLTFKNREIPTKRLVYETFKAKYPDKGLDNLEEVLKDIKKYASYYYKLINPETETDKHIKQQVKYINKIEINVSYPFLLEVYNDYESKVITKATFIAVLELIQSFVWRRFIIGLPTNALNKIFTTLYRDIDKDNYIESIQITLLKKTGTQRFPDDEDVKSELEVRDMYHIKSKNRMYCLERLENHDNKEPVLLEGNKDITIEHIFPQTPSSRWKKELSKEDFAKMKEKTNALANLTLSGNNGNLGNKYFIDKRDMPEKGYADSRLFLNRYLGKKDAWTPKELRARHRLLTKRFFEIWSYPDVELPKEENLDAINIFSIDNPTGKKIDYALWEGQYMELKTHRELLETIATEVYDINPTLFFNTDVGDRLRITPKGTDLKGPIQISEEYFIEGWLSAKEIFLRLKYMLKKAEKEEALEVKLC